MVENHWFEVIIQMFNLTCAKLTKTWSNCQFNFLTSSYWKASHNISIYSFIFIPAFPLRRSQGQKLQV